MTYSASATDNLDPSPTMSCAPASGSTFPIGITTVTCTTTDLAGNVAGATTSVTVTLGQPRLSGTIAAKGVQDSGVRFIDLRLTNTGTGHARNINLNQVILRTLSGSGTVTYNTSLSPALPSSVGNLDVGASTTIRLYVNVPSTVTRFSLTENGVVQDVAGTSVNYSIGQSVIP